MCPQAALQKLAVIKEHYQNPKPLYVAIHGAVYVMLCYDQRDHTATTTVAQAVAEVRHVAAVEPEPSDNCQELGVFACRAHLSSSLSGADSSRRVASSRVGAQQEETRLRAAEALIGRLYARIKSLETELEYARGGQGAGSHAPMNGYHGPGGVVSSPMTHGGYGGPDTPMGSPPVAFGTPRSQQVDQASPRGLGTTGDLDASIDINDDPDTEGVDMLIEVRRAVRHA